MTAEENLQAEYHAWMNSRQGPVTASMQREYWCAKAIALQEWNDSWIANPQVGTCCFCGSAIWRNHSRIEDENGMYHPDCKTKRELAEARQEIERLREYAQNMVDAWDHQGFAHLQKFVDEFKKGQP